MRKDVNHEKGARGLHGSSHAACSSERRWRSNAVRYHKVPRHQPRNQRKGNARRSRNGTKHAPLRQLNAHAASHVQFVWSAQPCSNASGCIPDTEETATEETATKYMRPCRQKCQNACGEERATHGICGEAKKAPTPRVHTAEPSNGQKSCLSKDCAKDKVQEGEDGEWIDGTDSSWGWRVDRRGRLELGME
eukprot:2698864-Pleurochrysis_carterae.AAC.2